MANHNIDRLTEDVKREISVAMHEIKDSRIADEIVSVSRVELTNDLSYCKVYISVLGAAEKSEAAVECLKKAAGFFKRRINSRIKMRKMPEFIFLEDKSLDYYDKMSRMLDNLPKPATTEETDDSEEN